MRAASSAIIRSISATGLALFGIAALIGAAANPLERIPALDQFAVAELEPESTSQRNQGQGSGTNQDQKERIQRKSLSIMNLRTGEDTPLILPLYDSADQFSVAPWTSESKGGLAVARWRRYSGKGVDRSMTEEGLALFSLPDGQLLTWANLDLLPTSPSCWLPGLEARVVFPAGDGALYTLNFDDSTPKAKPFPVIPETPIFRIQEIARPNVPSMDNFLLASVVIKDEKNHYIGPRLWWLKLRSQGDAIIAAGPLESPETLEDSPTVERWPSAFQGSGGRATLAFLENQNRSQEFQLRLAPLGFDPLSGGLKRLAKSGPILMRCLAITPPIFSANGHWFLASQQGRHDRKMVKRTISASFAQAR